MKPEGKYLIAPNEVILDDRLSRIQLRVLMALYSFRDKGDTKVWPSRAAIAERCGYTPSTISTAIKHLTQYGWIRGIKQTRGPNTYELALPDTLLTPGTVSEPGTVPRLKTVSGSKTNPRRTGDPTLAEPATPEQNKEQNKKQKQRSPTAPPCPHDDIIDLYNEILPTLRTALKKRWNGTTRARNLRSRWKEDPQHQSIEFWRWFFEAVKTKPFWMGESGGDFKACLEWLVKRTNFDKVVEHGYTIDHQRRQRGGA